MSDAAAATAEPVVVTKTADEKRKKPRHVPRYHVLLWNDEDHSFEYVILMLQALFGHPVEKGFKIAEEIHLRGKAIVLTTTKEHAELKRDQIHAFGKDALVATCQGAMSSTIEPAPGD